MNIGAEVAGAGGTVLFGNVGNNLYTVGRCVPVT
jgi:hypothetical protein